MQIKLAKSKAIRRALYYLNYSLIVLRGAVQKKLAFLAEMSFKGGGWGQNPCPLRKCKFLWRGRTSRMYNYTALPLRKDFFFAATLIYIIHY